MQHNEENSRPNRVARQLQRDLSEIFLKEAPRFAHGRMITVTRVRMSPDLEYAKVFLSVFPSGNAPEVLQAIKAQSGEIRYTLGRVVRNSLRVVPELTFELDDSLDYIERIEELLQEGQ